MALLCSSMLWSDGLVLISLPEAKRRRLKARWERDILTTSLTVNSGKDTKQAFLTTDQYCLVTDCLEQTTRAQASRICSAWPTLRRIR